MANAFVDKLRAVPELVEALSPDPLNPDASLIFAYIDDNPDHNQIDKAIYEMVPGSVMVTYTESNFEASEITAWNHIFTFFVRPPRRKGSGLKLLTILSNGVPDPGDGLRWRYCPVMDGLLPTEIGNMGRDKDSEGIDYFAVTTETRETGDI